MKKYVGGNIDSRVIAGWMRDVIREEKMMCSLSFLLTKDLNFLE